MPENPKNSFIARSGPLRSYTVTSLQANLGRLCNLSCNHCHLAASPHSTEVMPREVMEEIVRVVAEEEITRIDITGGAPELNPNLKGFIEMLSGSGPEIQLRTNLAAIMEPEQRGLAEYLSDKQVKLAGSLPCYQEANVSNQRGDKVFNSSIAALALLNSLGYGKKNGPALDLVYNPGGPFLPARQDELETIYRRELQQRYGISFSRLLVITNMPIGRFRSTLSRGGRLNEYFNILQSAYNEENLSSLMCRSQISVDWEGTIYDCDFNLALGLPSKMEKTHISSFDRSSFDSRMIATGNHCFGCTAGAGSSCSGALEVSG